MLPPETASTTPIIALLRPVEDTEPTMTPAAATATAMLIMLRGAGHQTNIDGGEAAR